MKKRNILLIEPAYKNKYPPIGLMKLSTYHRMLGDDVFFQKGELKKYILEDIFYKVTNKLEKVDNNVMWPVYKKEILDYLKTGKKAILEKMINFSKYKGLVKENLIFYKDYYKKGKYIEEPFWDRICITSLFTFNWKITIETINFAKKIIKNPKELWIGGVMASVLPEKIENATGVKPWIGLLNKPGILDKNDINIDGLELDYSILEEIDYKYPIKNSYFSYMTRGCINRCKFCAVPVIEKKYISYIPLKKVIDKSIEKYGEQKDLILLDNNVLASKKFDIIIDEIKEVGFYKNAKYTEPNLLELSIRNLKLGINDKAYIRKSFNLLNNLLMTLKNEKEKFLTYNLMKKYNVLYLETTTKENLLKIFPLLKEIYERRRTNKKEKRRYIDFNQGLDARLLTPEKMKRLSELSLKPLRIAFDDIGDKEIYVKAVKLAKENNIKELSNYLLFNFEDAPTDLYKRLKININLCEELELNIYSFPMKYHPIQDSSSENRNYIGKYWNRKFIRAIQVILNATKGKVGKGKDFFLKAFGNNEEEFSKILYMPETFILYRYFFEDIGLTEKWWQDFNDLSEDDKNEVKLIIGKNNFNDIDILYPFNSEVKHLLEYYKISRNMVESGDSIYHNLKKDFDKSKTDSKLSHALH